MKRAILAACAMLVLAIIPSATAVAGVNDFEITDFQIDYYLGRDSENRSTLRTVEVITAVFPDINQNHGLERAIPDTYDGHGTSLKIESVSDSTGKALNYTTYSSSGNTVVRIGDADKYVHGLQTYKIIYTQRDVTKNFIENNAGEFYWDTNGTEWKIPIRSLSARLHIDDSLAPALTGQQRCYQGVSGSTDTCAIATTEDGFAVAATDLEPYENVTMAVGFQSGTFASYKTPLFLKIMIAWFAWIFLSFPLGLAIFIWLFVRVYRRSNRSKEVTTIVPEYIQPKDASVTTAGMVYPRPGSVFTAQLLDLAVRHYIKIYETRPKTWLKPAGYELEIIKDPSDLLTEERELLTDIFGQPTVGAKKNMDELRNNNSFAMRLYDNPRKVAKDISGKYGLRAKNEEETAGFKRIARNLLILGLLTASPWFLLNALLALILGNTLKPFTDKGLELFRYLKGIEQYIKVAEVERLQMLQSPEGAAKVGEPVDGNDRRQLVKLYERVLPYAVLFGQEKQWYQQLGKYYESLNESPSWYSGRTGAFNAAAFTSGMSSFSQASTYAAPSSSSSGGSSGGGSSGGGGGGGGGGGW